MTLEHWICFLKGPDILQKERLLFYFILIAYDVSWIRRRNMQDFVFRVRDQLTAIGAG